MASISTDVAGFATCFCVVFGLGIKFRVGGYPGQWVECRGCLGCSIEKCDLLNGGADLVFYNRELGIMETYVDVGRILHNNSHIQGRKEVRILPEKYSPQHLLMTAPPR
jgi:hypothetical protein